jgi:hypothetical protein
VTDSWHFEDVKTLVRALEEYAEAVGWAGVANYSQTPSCGDPRDSSRQEDKLECVRLRNAAIDRALLRLRLIHPMSHLILHWYYRRGLVAEAGGWEKTWVLAGMPRFKQGRYYVDTFEALLEQAQWALFNCHQMRWKQEQKNAGGRS